MRDYVRRIVDEYEGFVSYNTTVELAEKVGDEWKVVLRKEGKDSDEWWVERFDAVVVATGHYWVPYVPKIEGLEKFERARPGSVIHSKHYRGRGDFCGKVLHSVVDVQTVADMLSASWLSAPPSQEPTFQLTSSTQQNSPSTPS